MLQKIIQPTVIVTLSVDLRGFVDDDDDLMELAVRALPSVPEGGRLRVDLGRARFDTRNVLGRALDDPVIGWRRAGEVELVGMDAEFLETVAASFERE